MKENTNKRIFLILDEESIEVLQIHKHSYDEGCEYDPLDEVGSLRIRDIFLGWGYQVWGIWKGRRVDI